MSSKTKITLSEGGTAERKITMSQLVIPDLWHIASGIRTGALVTPDADSADLILEVWHIAHDLKRYILNQPD